MAGAVACCAARLHVSGAERSPACARHQLQYDHLLVRASGLRGQVVSAVSVQCCEHLFDTMGIGMFLQCPLAGMLCHRACALWIGKQSRDDFRELCGLVVGGDLALWFEKPVQTGPVFDHLRNPISGALKGAHVGACRDHTGMDIETDSVARVDSGHGRDGHSGTETIRRSPEHRAAQKIIANHGHGARRRE